MDFIMTSKKHKDALEDNDAGNISLEDYRRMLIETHKGNNAFLEKLIPSTSVVIMLALAHQADHLAQLPCLMRTLVAILFMTLPAVVVISVVAVMMSNNAMRVFFALSIFHI
jgi:hypothetical protein